MAASEIEQVTEDHLVLMSSVLFWVGLMLATIAMRTL